MYRWRAFGKNCWRRIREAIEIFDRLLTTTFIRLHTKRVIVFVLLNQRKRDKYEEKILFKLHLPMVKGKRNGLTFRECSVKIRRFHRHIENEATTGVTTSRTTSGGRFIVVNRPYFVPYTIPYR